MGKENMAYTQNGALFSHIEEYNHHLQENE
jgi:hypothetical protein